MPEIPKPKHTTVKAIYEAYEQVPQQERTYLGCSTFGDDCDRALWYRFRWAIEPEKFDGRKLRLFQTGHREEARIIADLRSAGVGVIEVDSDTGKQWEVSACNGHLGGHLDGVALGVIEAPTTTHVLECKTHNDKSFRDLLVKGVKKSKPGHYRQMQLYMHLIKLTRALYVAVNKNDDNLYVERVRYDAKEGEALVKRAQRIIDTDVAPSKLYDDPNAREAFVCQWCPALSICHEKAMPQRRNCRTCISSSREIGGQWWCTHWEKFLTVAEQKAGCPKHLFLPSLMPGEQIDANEQERWIAYQMADGSSWMDREETP